MDNKTLFNLGKELYDAEHFSGSVYVKEVLNFDYPMLADVVAFAPSARNNWHIHRAGQVLIVTHGVGCYQEFGKKAQKLVSGDVIKIPSGYKLM